MFVSVKVESEPERGERTQASLTHGKIRKMGFLDRVFDQVAGDFDRVFGTNARYVLRVYFAHFVHAGS